MKNKRQHEPSNISVLEQNTKLGFAIVENVTPDGYAEVLVEGDQTARKADSTLQFSSFEDAVSALRNARVVVTISDHAPPVIIGITNKKLWTESDATDEQPCADGQMATLESSEAVELDKSKVFINAKNEIRLECGRSSLVMRRDGTVVVRGIRIISRALQSNKIKGGTVNIN